MSLSQQSLIRAQGPKHRAQQHSILTGHDEVPSCFVHRLHGYGLGFRASGVISRSPRRAECPPSHFPGECACTMLTLLLVHNTVATAKSIILCPSTWSRDFLFRTWTAFDIIECSLS